MLATKGDIDNKVFVGFQKINTMAMKVHTCAINSFDDSPTTSLKFSCG